MKAMSVTDQLKAAIRDSGVSPYEISKRSGVAPAVLSRFLTDQRSITLETADKICEVLGLTLQPAAPKRKR